MSIDSIQALLEARIFAAFIGLDEDTWFEAKLHTEYDLDLAEDRFELAKDVCAFANAEGGFIVLGLATEHLQVENTDRVRALSLCLQTAIDIERLQGIIREYVYPRSIEGLAVFWVEDGTNLGFGLGVIEIPPQNPSRKPFITSKVVEDGEHQKAIVVGYSRRNQSANDPLSPKQVYQTLRRGLSTESAHFELIHEKLDQVLRAQTATAAPLRAPAEEIIDQRIEELLSEDGE